MPHSNDTIRLSSKVTTEIYSKSLPTISIPTTKSPNKKHLSKPTSFSFNATNCNLFTHNSKGNLIDKNGNKIPYTVLLTPKKGSGIIKITQPIA